MKFDKKGGGWVVKVGLMREQVEISLTVTETVVKIKMQSKTVAK